MYIQRAPGMNGTNKPPKIVRFPAYYPTWMEKSSKALKQRYSWSATQRIPLHSGATSLDKSKYLLGTVPDQVYNG